MTHKTKLNISKLGKEIKNSLLKLEKADDLLEKDYLTELELRKVVYYVDSVIHELNELVPDGLYLKK